MLDKALVDIANRAARRSVNRAALAAYKGSHAVVVAPGTPSVMPRQQQHAVQPTVGAQLLDEAGRDYDGLHRQTAFEDRIGNLDTFPAVASPMDVLEKLHSVPHRYAMEAVGVLLRAGRTEEAVQLISGWAAAEGPLSRRRRSLSRRGRARASGELEATIAQLGELRDAQTLRVVAEVLEATLAEQAAFTGGGRTACAGCSPADKVRLSAFKLMAPLGQQRTRLAYAAAADAICRLSEEDGVFVAEKMALLEKAARVSSPGSPAAIPPALQRTFAECIESGPLYSEALARSVCEDLPALFASPAEYGARALVDLPMREARRAAAELRSLESLAAPASSSGGLLSLVSRFLNVSTPLQTAGRNAAILSALTGRESGTPRAAPSQLRLAARSSIVEALHSRSRPERNAVSAALLRRPQLLRALGISPCAVLATYGESFYTVSEANPLMSRMCLRAIPTLVRRGRERDAAKLAWNHLSAQCPATVALLRRDPSAVDFIAAAACRTMREARQSQDAWMAHRSLALLRTAHAANAATPAHIIALCTCALDLGVHFAAVKELVDDLYGARGDTGAWILNCVRVCAESQDESARLHVTRSSLPARIRVALQSWCGGYFGGSSLSRPSFLVVQSPSRSKQLALWSMTGEPGANPVLAALTRTLFLDPAARTAFLNCDHFECGWRQRRAAVGHAAPHRSRADPSPRQQQQATRFCAWEVAASVASNCTNDATYERMVNTLFARPALDAEQRQQQKEQQQQQHCGGTMADYSRARLRALLQTEIDYPDEKLISDLGASGGAHRQHSDGISGACPASNAVV